MHGPTCIFWANLTPFSLKGLEDAGEATARRELGFAHEARGLDWLRVLIAYAPTIAAVQQVLRGPVVGRHLEQLEGALCAKVRKHGFPTSAEILDLIAVLETVPGAAGMGLQLSAALVGNDEVDVFTGSISRGRVCH